MSRMKKLLSCVVVVGALCCGSVARAGDASDRVVGRVEALMKVPPKATAVEIGESLFAYRIIAWSVLPDPNGKYDRVSYGEYETVFTALLRKNLVSRLGELKGARMKWGDEVVKGNVVVLSARAVKGKCGEKSVDLEFVVEWVDGAWRVTDVVIEGASTVKTYRSQVKKMIDKGGFGAMMEKLRGKLAAEKG